MSGRSLLVGLLVWLSVGCGEQAEVSVPDDDGLDPAVEAQVDEWLSQLTLEEKAAQMHGSELLPADLVYPTADNARLGIPGFRMVDGPRGVASGSNTTFPVGMARGATFNPELETQVGEAMGLEARARGANVLLAPAINILRHPAWGRAQETYSEDVHHLSRMGVAFINGAQRHVIASAKHYAVNSIEDTRFKVSVELDQRTLREIYLPHFEAAVKEAKVGSVMSAYNRVNGTYCAENHLLLSQILKQEWGFTGFVESDWLLGTHNTVASANAGLDIEMPISKIYGPSLVSAVQAGDVELSKVDESVRRILRKKLEFKLDALEPVPESVVASPEHRELALEVARQGMVLLENRGALPLADTSRGSLAVIGKLSDAINLGDAGSSNNDPLDVVTALAGITARTNGGALVHIPSDVLTAEDEAALTGRSTAVVVVGLTKEDEGEQIPGRPGGDRETLALSVEQQALIARVSELVENTIVVLQGGSAITVEGWVDVADAVVMSWYSGMNGGTALAELLFGDISPSGKLPFAVPVSDADLVEFDHVSEEVSYGYFHGYRQLDQAGVAPRYPFGFGLSYASFNLASLEVPSSVSKRGDLKATVTLTNTSDREAAEVVQLYVGYPGSTLSRSPRELKAFKRVLLAPGEVQSVELSLPVQSLAYWDEASSSWQVEDIDYRVEVGTSSRDLPLSATFRVAR